MAILVTVAVLAAAAAVAAANPGTCVATKCAGALARCLADSVCRPWMFCTPRCPKNDLACQKHGWKRGAGSAGSAEFDFTRDTLWNLVEPEKVIVKNDLVSSCISCLKAICIDLSCLRGLGVETSTNPQMEVLRRSMTSVSAVSQSITASHSRSWPVRSLEMEKKDLWSSTPWLAPGMWLAAGIPSSIASTARCITSAFRKERNLCWVIWSNLLAAAKPLLSLKKDSSLAVGSISVYISSGYGIHSSPWKDPPCYQER